MSVHRLIRGKHEEDEKAGHTEHETPSGRDGISQDSEMCARAYACTLIQEAGILLRLPQVVMVTAQMLFHRFFLRVSLKRYSHLWAAAAALFLATKVEEQHRKLREVVTMVHSRMVSLRSGSRGGVHVLDYYGSAGYLWKTEVIRMERCILNELGFSLHLQHPHKYILIYVNTMKDHSSRDEGIWKALLQLAWNYANDCMRTDLTVQLAPEAVACGCIRMAAKQIEVVLPEEESSSCWFSVFHSSQVRAAQLACGPCCERLFRSRFGAFLRNSPR
mmetsp:Transcript_3523/g.6642  ORF Transcript_3523/g.6642 Transcript_3523/m.6642 type:complete len:275 (-) Transcript_3523:508-1332(-)